MRVRKNALISLSLLCLALVLLPPSIEAKKARSAASVSQATTHAFSSPATFTPIESSLDIVGDASTVTTTRGGQKAAAPTQDSLKSNLLERVKIAAYFAVWYALNIVYNIINKKVLNVLPAPLTVGSIQFGVGALYASLLWMLKLRSAPTNVNKKQISHIGLHHSAGQLLSMISLGAGPVSFTHIVKALEPFFSALVSALVFGKWMQPQVYATLLPVVGGVGYACLKERSFSWLAFNCAMSSNVAFALRAVLSKTAMTPEMTAANLFGLVTWAAWLISIPIALIAEGSTFGSLWKSACDQVGEAQLIQQVVLSGLFHYLNNEVMYLALSNVHPVTLAVGNTMKRVFIMVASVLVFRNPVSLQAGIGSFIGISGVLLYSLTKQHYEQLEAAAAAQEGKGGRNKRAVANNKNKKQAGNKKTKKR